MFSNSLKENVRTQCDFVDVLCFLLFLEHLCILLSEFTECNVDTFLNGASDVHISFSIFSAHSYTQTYTHTPSFTLVSPHSRIKHEMNITRSNYRKKNITEDSRCTSEVSNHKGTLRICSPVDKSYR